MEISKIKLNKKKLKDQKVGLVLLFGSQIAGAKHPKSDVDLGIVFLDETKKREHPVEVFGALYEEFSKKFDSDKIDIVYLKEAPLSLQYKAISDGLVLYADSGTFYADYKEITLRKYFDFKFFEDIFNEAIIKVK